MTIRAVDCQGFAGGFTLGAVQAGLQLVGKREMQGGFGAANCEVNRHLLGYDWEGEACDPMEWSVPSGGAHVVFGNPPCSGFSGLSSKHFRGVDSPINHCMWAFVDYTARVMPLIAIFESVRTAYSKGRSLMQDLRAKLEATTGARWDLHHVVHEANALGGPAIRRRYFWVATRVKFGVEHPMLPFAATLHDAIGDLVNLDYTWLPQPYASPPTRWSQHRRSPTETVDGHVTMHNPMSRRFADLAAMIGWQPSENVSQATRRCYQTYGKLPESWAGSEAKLISTDFNFGFNAIARWRFDLPGRVITGIGPNQAVHPTRDRTLTYRETARIMGFPDDWLINPLRNVVGLAATWGKGITVDAGRWIATWAKRSIEGHPGSNSGKLVGDREFEVVVSKPIITCDTVSNAQEMTQQEMMTVGLRDRRRSLRRQASNTAPVDASTSQHQAESPTESSEVTTMTSDAPDFQADEVTTLPNLPSFSADETTSSPDSISSATTDVFTTEIPADDAATDTAATDDVTTDADVDTSATTTSGGRRGRPRPADVVQRDEIVLGLIGDTGVTRNELIEKLAGTPPFDAMDADTRGTRVYQSLWRLRRGGLIVRDRDGKSHAWKSTASNTDAEASVDA